MSELESTESRIKELEAENARLRERASSGGKKSAANMTPARRQARARKAAQARWNGRKTVLETANHICCSINLGANYTSDQQEFLAAVDNYKRNKKRPFPTCCELLDILLSLGYRKDFAS